MNSHNSPREPNGRSSIHAIDFRALGRYWPVAAVVALAAIIRSFSWLNCDVSWLLTLGEKVLAGARPYVDFNELNPPASILIYVPAILVGQFGHVSPECIVTVAIFAGVFSCLWMVGRILPEIWLAQSRQVPALFALACAMLLILPGDAFAQREHIALLAILPMLALYAARASGAPIDTVLASLAGVGGGIAVSIKPHFALALILSLPYVAWRWKTHHKKLSALILLPEHRAATLVVLAYCVLIIWRFSDYLHRTIPLVLNLYAPLKYSQLFMVANPSILLVAMTAIVGLGLGMKEYRAPFTHVAGLAVLGFSAALIIQGKGWPYHGYPAIALSLLVLSVLLIRRISAFLDSPEIAKSLAIDSAFAAVLFAGIYALASFWFLIEPGRGRLVLEVSRLVPAHPRILSINGGPELAFPLTRKLHGTPIGRAPFQWISYHADSLLASVDVDLATRQKIEEYARADRMELAGSIRAGRPDAILVGGRSERLWAFSHREIAAVLGTYRQAETVDDVEIWLPRRASKGVSP